MYKAAIKPSKSIAYKHKKSPFPQLDGVLPLRWSLASPSGAGKGVAMQNMILKHFRGCWERIYVFSPTAVLDKSTWDPVRKHLTEDRGIDLVKEPAFFEEWDDGATLDSFVKQNSEVVRKQKERGARQIFGALFVIDDWGDRADVMHKASGSVIGRLFLSGRHHGVLEYSCVLVFHILYCILGGSKLPKSAKGFCCVLIFRLMCVYIYI